eukprot:gene10200-8114_t
MTQVAGTPAFLWIARGLRVSTKAVDQVFSFFGRRQAASDNSSPTDVPENALARDALEAAKLRVGSVLYERPSWKGIGDSTGSNAVTTGVKDSSGSNAITTGVKDSTGSKPNAQADVFGRNAILFDFPFELGLTTLGEGAVIERYTIWSSHYVLNRRLHFENSSVGDRAWVHAGVRLEGAGKVGPGGIVLASSMLMIGDTVPPSLIYAGCPAAPKGHVICKPLHPRNAEESEGGLVSIVVD